MSIKTAIDVESLGLPNSDSEGYNCYVSEKGIQGLPKQISNLTAALGKYLCSFVLADNTYLVFSGNGMVADVIFGLKENSVVSATYYDGSVTSTNSINFFGDIKTVSYFNKLDPVFSVYFGNAKATFKSDDRQFVIFNNGIICFLIQGRLTFIKNFSFTGEALELSSPITAQEEGKVGIEIFQIFYSASYRDTGSADINSNLFTSMITQAIALSGQSVIETSLSSARQAMANLKSNYRVPRFTFPSRTEDGTSLNLTPSDSYYTDYTNNIPSNIGKDLRGMAMIPVSQLAVAYDVKTGEIKYGICVNFDFGMMCSINHPYITSPAAENKSNLKTSSISMIGTVLTDEAGTIAMPNYANPYTYGTAATWTKSTNAIFGTHHRFAGLGPTFNRIDGLRIQIGQNINDVRNSISEFFDRPDPAPYNAYTNDDVTYYRNSVFALMHNVRYGYPESIDYKQTVNNFFSLRNTLFCVNPQNYTKSNLSYTSEKIKESLRFQSIDLAYLYKNSIYRSRYIPAFDVPSFWVPTVGNAFMKLLDIYTASVNNGSQNITLFDKIFRQNTDWNLNSDPDVNDALYYTYTGRFEFNHLGSSYVRSSNMGDNLVGIWGYDRTLFGIGSKSIEEYQISDDPENVLNWIRVNDQFELLVDWNALSSRLNMLKMKKGSYYFNDVNYVRKNMFNKNCKLVVSTNMKGIDFDVIYDVGNSRYIIIDGNNRAFYIDNISSNNLFSVPNINGDNYFVNISGNISLCDVEASTPYSLKWLSRTPINHTLLEMVLSFADYDNGQPESRIVSIYKNDSLIRTRNTAQALIKFYNFGKGGNDEFMIKCSGYLKNVILTDSEIEQKEEVKRIQ